MLPQFRRNAQAYASDWHKEFSRRAPPSEQESRELRPGKHNGGAQGGFLVRRRCVCLGAIALRIYFSRIFRAAPPEVFAM